jgi:hypothetical protein
MAGVIGCVIVAVNQPASVISMNYAGRRLPFHGVR